MNRTTSRGRRVSSADIARIFLGWGAFGALQLAGTHLEPTLPAATLAATLGMIVGVIIICAFGVVTQAEALARRLGDPYGSLVLTLSIVVIEVILIAAIMFGTGEHATIGRDSVMAVSMIILNLVIGLSIVLGSRRHRRLVVNRQGTVAYLSMITVLGFLGFALPRWIGHSGSYTTNQEVPIIVAAVVVYAAFLYRQMGPRADDFREPDVREAGAVPTRHQRDSSRHEVATRVLSLPTGQARPDQRTEVTTRLVVLVATMIPIVLVSHDMATLLDDGLARLDAPVALSGVLIAVVVFLPEGLTSVRAALGGEMQRVSNLCHGALVSTLALTIPAVLGIGMVTGETVVLAESPINLALLAVTTVLSWVTFTARRLTAGHGAAHLVLFVAYGVTMFA
ncbi:MAG TPA: hypothetical protein VFN21_02295 [Acidimicrobiales bacterium]|nr:hypothetical protein [Acidimicrobiales bacterium]